MDLFARCKVPETSIAFDPASIVGVDYYVVWRSVSSYDRLQLCTRWKFFMTMDTNNDTQFKFMQQYEKKIHTIRREKTSPPWTFECISTA